MCEDCRGFIAPGSKILDLGCGTGIVGKKFQDYFNAELLGLDVNDKRTEKINFLHFDGEIIPFSENRFDVVLLNYVLHHAREPVNLLKEAKRVGGKIIVHEDLPEGVFSKLACLLHGISFDRLWGNPSRTSFQTGSDWKKDFAKIGLKLIFEKEVNSFPVKKQLFVLE